MNVITRFAPSPTGNLHVGNVRTALYAWLFARNQSGKFILRIEDTNSDFKTKDIYTKNIINVMKWLRLDWDEGPYFQSHRLHRYHDVINNMLKHQLAYKCYCSQDRLESLRLEQIKNKKKPKYDGYCRMKSIISHNHFGDHSDSFVIRFCNPLDGDVIFYDQIRGSIRFNNEELDDLIICRSNGMPTYNFCVVVDDIDMNITHIIRGEEHINNTPRQINIMKALKVKIPVYIHVPMIVDSNRKKVSKRYQNSSIIRYRDDGFLPEAVLNYLIRLGWSYKNHEIFSIDQMKQYFCLNKISKSASILNFDKLLWLNRYYIHHLPVNYVAQQLLQYIQIKNISCESDTSLSDVVQLFSKRCNTLKDIIVNYMNLYKDFDIFEKTISKQYLTPIVIIPLKSLRKKLNNIKLWTNDAVQNAMLEIITECKINLSTICMVVRVALTGVDISPKISMVMYVLGKRRVLNRIDQAISYIQYIS